MPRYYRRRYTRTLVRPKKKWATNIKEIEPQWTGNEHTSGVFYFELAKNASPTSTPTPVIVKTGNFKLQSDTSFLLSGSGTVNFTAYILYVPEGLATELETYTGAKDFVLRHPEWILLWKHGTYDYASGQANIEGIKASSRLKRNLNSGDSIYFVGLANIVSLAGVTFTSGATRGWCQYWCCAN